jgi:hypothetical protein
LESRDICQVVMLDGSTVGVGDIAAFAERLLVPPFVLHGFSFVQLPTSCLID